ncbi:MAG: hypothetical protein KAH05_06995 [Clostridiales bacterium]|nr:hypothetical protein [Clostridiales bacterium]
MSITIPSDKGKPGLPQFKLTGEKIISENPAESTTLTSSVVPAWIVKDGTSFTQQDVIIMSESVEIEIVDADGGGNVIPSYTDGDFMGGKPFNGTTIGGNFEIYYTLNGKDPVRTKAYLYTGKFDLSTNQSGSDNTIIKTRSYINGLWSEIAKIELRIAASISSTNTDPDPDPST